MINGLTTECRLRTWASAALLWKKIIFKCLETMVHQSEGEEDIMAEKTSRQGFRVYLPFITLHIILVITNHPSLRTYRDSIHSIHPKTHRHPAVGKRVQYLYLSTMCVAFQAPEEQDDAPLPPQAIPTAIAAPYRRWGL
jgi:hypothetical protein